MSTRPRSVRREALARARELLADYAANLEGGQYFNLQEVLVLFLRNNADLAEGALEAFLEDSLMRADRELRNADKPKSDDESQPSLFNFDVLLALGGHDRILKGSALQEQWLTSQSLKKKNIDRVNDAFARDQAEGELLRDYWKAHMTMRQAADDYLADHPDALS